MRELRAVPLALLLMAALLAYKRRSAPVGEGDATGGAAPVAPLAATSAVVVAPSASAAAAVPSLAELFAGPPLRVRTTKVPIRGGFGFTGAVAVAPEGFTGDEWDPNGVAGPAYRGDVYGDALIFSSADGYASLHYRAERAKPGAAPLRPSATTLLQHAYPAGIGKPKWEEPVEGTVGEQRSPAVIWRGEGVGVVKGAGQPWRVYVVSLVVNGKQVLVAGAWDASHPEHEAAIIDGIKGIRG
jgi:hypothetical protein